MDKDTESFPKVIHYRDFFFASGGGGCEAAGENGATEKRQPDIGCLFLVAPGGISVREWQKL